MKDYVYLLEDPTTGFVYKGACKTRQEARKKKKACDESYDVKHKIVRYVREEIIR